MMTSEKMGKRKRRSKYERNVISLVMCIFRMEFLLLITQVALSNCAGNWGPFVRENSGSSRLQNRLSTSFQHRPLSSHSNTHIGRSTEYRNPVQSTPRLRRKSGKADTRSLQIINSKINENPNVFKTTQEPNYSAFSGLSSYASFNIVGNHNIPQSQFRCRNRAPGYYADIELDCKVYHLCTRHGGGMTFQCPEKTVFQQRTMVCNHEHMVNCSLSEKYYDSNLRIGTSSNLIDDGGGSNGNVFMQVIVKNALEEDKRVARYPKPHSKSVQKQTKTANISESPSSETTKDFMQLVYDDSLLKQSSKKKIESKPFHQTTTLFDVNRPSKNTISSHVTKANDEFGNFNKQHVELPNDNYKFSGFNPSEGAKDESHSHFLELNDLQVKNDPESFKRSIPHQKHKTETKHNHTPKIEPLPTEIVPHPRGGPDSHDVFKFDFDSQFPSRPSFTFSEPTSWPQSHDSTSPSVNFFSANNVNSVSTSPTENTSVESTGGRNKKPQKYNHHNIVWNKFTSASKPLKPDLQKANKRKKPKPTFKNKLSGLKSTLKGYRLPSSHPLRSIIPKTARVVGIQSIKRNKAWLQGVNRNDKPPHIMTVEDFLKMYPNMNNIRGAIPVPLSEKKHVRMIELLAAQSRAKNGVRPNTSVLKNHVSESLHNPKRQIHHTSFIPSQIPPRRNKEQSRTASTLLPNKESNIDEMLKELDKLIKERAEKRVIHFQPLSPQTIDFKDNFVSTQENHIFHEDKTSLKKFKQENIKSFRPSVTPAVVTIRPRGEGPSVRFTSTTSKTPIALSTSFSFREKDVKNTTLASSKKPSTASPPSLDTKSEFDLSPKLEFGFKPITTKSYFSFATSTTPPAKTIDKPVVSNIKKGHSTKVSPLSPKTKSTDPFQTEFDTFNEIIEPNSIKFATRYPRLIPSDPNSLYASSTIKNKNKSVFKSNIFKNNNNDRGKDNRLNSIISSDPFFFTTTTAKPILFSQNDVDSSFSTSGGISGISSTLFDMRKFFFIPKKSKAKQSSNLVPSSSKNSGQNRRIWRKPPRRTFFPRSSFRRISL